MIKVAEENQDFPFSLLIFPHDRDCILCKIKDLLNLASS